MSYDKKMKDLMARLMSMSPEPPPYPEEETPMARHETRKERRPALVFAGAVALVALLAVPLLLFTGREDPVAIPSSTTTSTVASSTTTAPATTTTAEATTTSTAEQVASTWTGTVFLYQTPEDSNLGNPALVPVSLDLTGVSANEEFTAALAAVGPELPELSYPLSNAVPADVQVLSQSSIETDNGFLLTLDMNEAFIEGAGGLLADMTMLNQLIYSATEPFLEQASVLFTVNGEPVEAFGSEGLVLTDPVNRDTFIEELAPIFLSEPIMETENVWVVAGRANTFEAALTLRVLDGSGAVVHEEPAMATCGSGCWGEFGISIDVDLIVPGESAVQLLTFSAEDGEPTNVVTIPIPADGVWKFTLGG